MKLFTSLAVAALAALHTSAVPMLDIQFQEFPLGYDLEINAVDLEPNADLSQAVYHIGQNLQQINSLPAGFLFDYTNIPGGTIPDFFTLGLHTVTFTYSLEGETKVLNGSYTVTQLPSEVLPPIGVPDGGSTAALTLAGVTTLGALGLCRRKMA